VHVAPTNDAEPPSGQTEAPSGPECFPSLHERRTNYSRDSGSPKPATLVIPIAAGTTVAGTRCGINQIVAGKIAARAKPINGRLNI